MAFLPFTLISLVCLMHFHENMAKPYLGMVLDTWPQNCLNQNYCTEKPDDYPSESRLEELYSNLFVNFDLPRPDDLETGHRSGGDLCKMHEYIDPVYMIIDENDEPRYTVQIPGVHEFNVTLRTCFSPKDQMLDDLREKIDCRQTYTPLPFLVLSHDRLSMEVARVKEGLPTNCAPIFKENSMENSI